jgi:hypothetical protein
MGRGTKLIKWKYTWESGIKLNPEEQGRMRGTEIG